jgi:pimeloyl-ACP methyl ester carboxylesterase
VTTPAHPRRARLVRAVGAAAALAVLVGCSGGSGDEAPTSGPSASSPSASSPSASSSAPSVAPASTDVPFTDCGEACEGEIKGAKYRILLPTAWNGTLLIYSHGYRNPAPAPPDYGNVSTKADPSPGYGEGGTPLARNLLAMGYALAGSGWRSNGWAVSDGVKANTDLYEFFREEVGEPERVYAWGDSLGGLVTMELAEAHPEWVSGAAPLCGVVGGILPNMDLALDVAYGVRELIDPELRLTDYASAREAGFEWVRAAQAVAAAAADKEDRADVVALALLADAELRTKSQDGSTIDSQVQAAAEAALIGLRFGTVGRWDVEERFGGNISDNTDTDYAARFSAEDRALLDEIGGDGTARRIIAALADGTRLKADADAVKAARRQGGEPSGTIEVPTITLHTAVDPLVAVQNETLLREVSGDTDRLVQLFTVPPETYAARPGAPYGAGHCEFTPDSRIGMIELLDDWVRGGQRPTPASVAEAFGRDSGFDPGFTPGPWPE